MIKSKNVSNTLDRYQRPVCEVLKLDIETLLCSSLNFGDVGEAGTGMGDDENYNFDL